MLLCLYYVLMFLCLKYMFICYYVFIYYSVFFHLFLVKMRNFPKKYLVVRKLYVNLHRKVRIGVCGR